MRRFLMRGLLLGGAVLVITAAVPAAVFAQAGEDRSRNVAAARDELKTQATERQQKRLDAAKLRQCEARQKTITSIMARAVVRAENQVKVFTSISERVQAFYVKKGQTLPSYDALVTAVADAKAKVQADVEALKALDPFDCDSDDPKGSAEDFKAALKLVNEDLKAYRTAIKNLIVGVKSVQSAEGGQQ